MIFLRDDGPQPPGRYHPWTQAMKNNQWQYHDFKQRPELISSVLEDFHPYADEDATKTFYDLLRWINGPDSNFESNDCGLRPPRIDMTAPPIVPFNNPIVLHSRLTILFRELGLNSRADAVQWLVYSICGATGSPTPTFPAVMKVGVWPHLFVATGQEGYAVQLLIWAWGDTEKGAMHNLNLAYIALSGRLHALSSAIPNSVRD